MQDRVNGCITNEDTVKAVQEFEQIIQNKKSDIVQLATSCGQRHRVVKGKGKYFRSLERKNNLFAIWS